MRKWLLILMALLPVLSCVGQKEDPEEFEPSTEDSGSYGEAEGTVFYHRILALGFTATWCQYCPNMSEAIAEASAQRPGRIIPLAVHYMDELSPEESDALNSAFSVPDYPTLFYDMDPSTQNGGKDASAIVAYVDQAIKTPPPGLSAKADEEDGTLTLELKVKAVKDATYTVAAAWAQDNVSVANQAGYGPGYRCQAVLRGYLAPGTGGKVLAPLKEGEEGTVSFTGAVPAFEEPYLVVYIMEAGIAVNAIRLKSGETLDYAYEKTD